MHPAILALAALALIAACAPAPDSGLAGCFEATPDGRIAYRWDWEPNSRGMCPTRTEMVNNAAMDARFEGASCRMGCRLGVTLMLLNSPHWPAISKPVGKPVEMPAARKLPVPMPR